MVVEPKSAGVTIAGRRIALPAKQFALMRELTADPGAALNASDLIARVWEGRPGMTSSDLHALVWRLRRRIGDDGPEPRIIVNRKGLGYLIDTDTVDVSVVDLPRRSYQPPVSSSRDEESVQRELEKSGSESPTASNRATGAVPDEGVVEPRPSPAAVGSTHEAGAIDPKANVGVTFAGGPTSDSREVDVRSGSGARLGLGGNGLRGWLIAAALLAAFGSAGAVGGFVTSDDPPAVESESNASEPDASASPAESDRAGSPKNTPRRRPRPNPPRKDRRPSRSSPVVIAAPPASGPSVSTAPPATSPARQAKPPSKRPPVALPPPPTRYLYHLYNTENGDHFVTTDGGAVTEHEAKGYEGGAIARVYVAPEKDTKAIALNFGSAFIFIDSAPKTDPASVTVPLWLAKNNAGDFFYSTSKTEASQDGWSATLIGYVRTL